MMLHLQGVLIAWVGILISIFQGAESQQAVCAPGVTEIEVSSSEDAQVLVDALDCIGGGVFDVTWSGSVVISETFVVQTGTSLNITGSSGSATFHAAVIDAEGTTAIFSVRNASTLNLDNMVLQGGGGNSLGGAISLSDTNGGVLNVFDCTFRNNTAVGGGAIYAQGNSKITISGATIFTGNSATFGGAISAGTFDNITSSGVPTFTGNSATGGGVSDASTSTNVTTSGATTFTGNSAKFGGAIFAGFASVVIREDTTFINNSAVNGGAIRDYDSILTIGDDVAFTSNWATNGGAISGEASEATISDNVEFRNNSALFDGGAISATAWILTIRDGVTFVENSADVDGGAINIFESTLYVERGVYFTDNAAIKSGGAISVSYPEEFVVNRSTFSSNVAEFGGAVALLAGGEDQGTEFEGCIFEGNNATDGGALYLYSNQDEEIVHNSTFRGNYAEVSGGALFHTGFVTITHTVFVANKAGEDGLAVFSIGGFNEPSNVTFESNTLNCPIGEFGYDLKFEQNGSNSCRFELTCARCSTGCDAIPSGVDVTEITVPTCEELMVGANASSRDTVVATLDLKGGYYRTSNESQDLRECYSEHACVGGLDADNYCADGYEGPYCAVCADGYAPGIAYSCHKCSGASKRSAVFMIVTVLLVMLLLVVVVVSDLVRVVGDNEEGGRNAEQRSRASWKKASSSCHTILVKAFPLTAIKTIVVVWQIVTQFGAIAGNVYPAEYQDFISNLSLINLDIGFMLSYSCLMTTDFYDRLVIATIGPILVLVALTVTSSIAKKRNKSSELAIRAVRHKHISAALFVMFFIYSSVSFTIFQTFVCDTLDNEVSYLRADYSLTCGTNTHSAFRAYAVVMVFVYPVGIPAAFSWWLGRNRQDLRKPDRDGVAHLEPFNSLWTAYMPSRYYYEVVECGRRIMLTGIAVFVLPETSAQIAIVLLLAVVFLFVSESMSPFERGVDMGLYRWGNGVVLASMYSALLLKVEVSKEKSATLSAFVVVLIAANVFMVVTVLVESYLLVKEWRTPTQIVKEAVPPCPQTWSSGCLEGVQEKENEGVVGKWEGGSFITNSANKQNSEV